MKTKQLNEFLALADKVGVVFPEDTQKNLSKIDFKQLKVFDYLPEMILMIRDFVTTENIFLKRQFSKSLEPMLTIAFNNVFGEQLPNVQISPVSLYSEVVFKKNQHRNQMIIWITQSFLQNFLNDEEPKLKNLFNQKNEFWMEEIVSEDMIRVIHEIMNAKDVILEKSFYKLKMLELIYYLFRNITKRKETNHSNLSVKEIIAVYKVRDKLVSSLQKPSTIKELKQVAGMNELKMRKFFIQVFGMGIYDYYQHLRMKEAARLISDKKLSVSEVGYQMGFENLSHFSRVFEKHIGLKPKKYSSSKSLPPSNNKF